MHEVFPLTKIEFFHMPTKMESLQIACSDDKNVLPGKTVLLLYSLGKVLWCRNRMAFASPLTRPT